MRLHVVNPTDRAMYADALDQHHVIRKRVYIDEQNWRALRAVDGRERDQFDTETTVYLLAMDADGRVGGGTRLHPSLGPTLLSDVFPNLAERGFERRPDVWEWTRFFVAPQHRGDGLPSPFAGVVLGGMIEHCLVEGISLLNVVSETWWLPRWAGLGLAPRPLGLPIEHDGMTITASAITVTEEALDRIKDVYGLRGSLLAQRSVGPRPNIEAPGPGGPA